jgi:hypothetical protein
LSQQAWVTARGVLSLPPKPRGEPSQPRAGGAPAIASGAQGPRLWPRNAGAGLLASPCPRDAMLRDRAWGSQNRHPPVAARLQEW